MKINVKDTVIGGSFIPVQTMLKNPVTDLETSLEKIKLLEELGCDILRITVPDSQAARALKQLIPRTSLPIVADIHFDYRLAIEAIEAGVHKVRINPGNIGSKEKVQKVVDCLKQHHIPARIGINKGSLPEHLLKVYGDPLDVMLEAAREEIACFEAAGYNNIVLSFKSSNVLETIEINRRARASFPYPLHIGVTEAGDFIDGTIKNCAGLSILLLEGIGDTIRVSLTAPEQEEVIIGKKLLQSLGKLAAPFEIISCPTCGRCEVDIQGIVKTIKEEMAGKKFSKLLKIAVMGCIVNGPGEAKECDFGVACGKEKSLVFKDGSKIKMIDNHLIKQELLQLLEEYYET